ncbi:MAG TPA: hypothetical protein VGI85_06085 [Chthoniobacterales bacterium]
MENQRHTVEKPACDCSREKSQSGDISVTLRDGPLKKWKCLTDLGWIRDPA